MKSGHGTTRRTIDLRLLGGASALVLVLASSGCGTQTGAEAQRLKAPQDVSVSLAQPDYIVSLTPEQTSIVDKVRLSYDSWAGGVESRQAAAVIQAYADNAGIDECVEDGGHALYPGWRIAIQPTSYRPWYSSSILLAPPVRTVTYEASVNAESARLEPLLHKTPSPEVDAILNECLRSHTHRGRLLNPTSEEELEAMLYPQAVSDLEQKWSTAMEQAVGAAALEPDEVWSCFTAADPGGPFVDTDPGDFAEDWWQIVVDQLPDPANVPQVGQTSDDPGWQTALQSEALLTTVLWDCHDEDYDEALVAAEGAAARFMVDNAAEIAVADAAWQRVRATARTMGWSPNRPVAGLTVASR